jgi:L-gulono-1,4-lactone dehydrogenase
MTTWRNWSRELSCTPARVARPNDTSGVVHAVRRAAADGHRIRPVGSGHSFTPLVVTDEVQLDLSGCDRILHVDHERRRVRVQAGIRLGALAEGLAHHGLAMENLGDIDRQTLAGATATGTHGTGPAFGNLSTQIRSLRLVDARGEVHDLGPPTADDGDRRTGPDDERLLAARIGLGALGVVTEIELQVVDAFVLRGHDRTEPLDRVMAQFDQRVASHRHFEFYAFPYSDRALTRTNDVVDGPPRPPGPVASWLTDRLLTTHVFGAISRAGRRVPAAIPRLNRLVARAAGEHVRVDASHRVFTTARDVRFTEMELSVPRAAGMELLGEILDLIERERLPVNFLIEIRTTAGDDNLLSPAHGRDATYVAVHNFVGLPFEDYFAGVWELARRHGARPHWGKRHPATAADLSRLYPRWDDFARVRASFDPDGRFANDHLDRVLGPVRAG